MSVVLMSNMHGKVFDSFCRIFDNLGVGVVCPVAGGGNYLVDKAGAVAPTPSNTIAEQRTIHELDDVDVVLCCCWEQLKGASDVAKKLDVPLIVRAGNNNVPYRAIHSDFLISSDRETYERSDIPHKEFVLLPPDYDFYKPVENYSPSSGLITSLIHFYERYWTQSFRLYDKLRKARGDLAFVNFGTWDGNGEYMPVLANASDVRDILSMSRLMLHVKEKEGYGWSILEAIAMGIPVVVCRKYVLRKTCELFLKGHLSCLYLDMDNLIGSFGNAVDNRDALYAIHENGPSFIRGLVTMEEARDKVGRILEMALS